MRFARTGLVPLLMLSGCVPAPAPVVVARSPQQPVPSCAVFADLDIPLEGDIEVAVFNGSDVAGLGRQAATEFAARGFQVTRWEADESRPDSLAVLRFGPAAVGRATLVNAYLFGRARLEHDAARQGRTVDVVVGKDFKQVATPAEKDQALGMIGLPRPPDGTCAR